MKYVVAPDSFKESMTAEEAAQAMEEGIRSADPEAECLLIPMSDGGEGFARAVATAWGATWVEIDSEDALGRPIRSGYGLAGDRAVIDIASSAGLEQIPEHERDVENSSSAGLGVLIRDAVIRGARHIIVGIGGSATNDAGAGMLVALGARLLDHSGHELRGTLGDLALVETVDLASMGEELGSTQFLVACDVSNPLTGPRGATAIFGPQKGVSPDSVDGYDASLERFARLTGEWAAAERPGAGAAGGVGFALMAFLDADLRAGVELLSEIVRLPTAVEGADLVLTGEGSVDAQTLEGKTPAGVAGVAAEAGVPVLLFAGKVKPGAEVLLDHGVSEIVQIADDGVPLAEALENGFGNLKLAVERTVSKYRI